MSLYRSNVIVLRSRNLGEADRVLTLLSEDRGKFDAVVKGARRQRSRFIGNTLPFNLINAMFFPGKNLDQLSQAELVHSFSTFREDLIKMAYASYWAELIAEFVPERENVPELFKFLVAAQITLEKNNDPEMLNLAFQMRLLNYLGYQPHLEGCVACGKDTGTVFRFSIDAGGLVCQDCTSEIRDLMNIKPAEIQFLNSLAATDIRQLAGINRNGVQLSHIRSLLRRFIEARLERPLKSQVFLDSVLS